MKEVREFPEDLEKIKVRLDERSLTPEECAELIQEYNNSLPTDDEVESVIEELDSEIPMNSIEECIDNIVSQSIDSIIEREIQNPAIDVEEVFRLYYEDNLTMEEIAKLFGYKSSTPISRIFQEEGWKPRYMIKIDPEEVHRLYFDEGLTLTEVAKKLGFKSQTPIRRVFKEQNWETRNRWKQLDASKIYDLYFKKRLSLNETAQRALQVLTLDSAISLSKRYKNKFCELFNYTNSSLMGNSNGNFTES